jgi:hypothetical protein
MTRIITLPSAGFERATAVFPGRKSGPASDRKVNRIGKIRRRVKNQINHGIKSSKPPGSREHKTGIFFMRKNK